MIIKDKIKGTFIQVPSSLILDPNLTRTAKLLFIYLLGQAPHWEINNADIKLKLNIGADKTIAHAWKLLIKQGWVTRSRKRDSNNKLLGGYDYTLHTTASLPYDTFCRIRQNFVYDKKYDPNYINEKPTIINPTNKANIVKVAPFVVYDKKYDTGKNQQREEVCLEHGLSNCKKCKALADKVRKEFEKKCGTLKTIKE